MPTLMICTVPSLFGDSLETMPGAPCSSGPAAGTRHISPASLLPNWCSSDFLNLVPKASPAPDTVQDTHFYSTLETQIASTEILLWQHWTSLLLGPLISHNVLLSADGFPTPLQSIPNSIFKIKKLLHTGNINDIICNLIFPRLSYYCLSLCIRYAQHFTCKFTVAALDQPGLEVKCIAIVIRVINITRYAVVTGTPCHSLTANSSYWGKVSLGFWSTDLYSLIGPQLLE